MLGIGKKPVVLSITPVISPEGLHTNFEASEKSTYEPFPTELDLPGSPAQHEALILLARLDQSNNSSSNKLLMSPELTVALFDTELRKATNIYRKVFGKDSKISGEPDLLEASLRAAEAIAGILATPLGVTDPQERDALEQSMVDWLARAKRVDWFIEEGVKTHTDWSESKGAIAHMSALALSDPRFEAIPLSTVMSRTLGRIDIQDRIERLASAVMADNPKELGKAAGQAFEHPDRHVAAGLQAKAFFELAASLGESQSGQKEWALLQAKHLFDTAFASIDIDDDGPEAELSPEQAVQLRLYGQTIHDLAELRPNPEDRVSVSMRKRAITYLTKSLQNHTVFIEALKAEKGEEDEARMDMAAEARVYDAKGFTNIRDELASLNIELFNGWVRMKDYKHDIDDRGQLICDLGEERNLLNERLLAFSKGLPDPVDEPDNNDPRPIEERIRTRLDTIASTLPRLHEDIRRVNIEKQKFEDKLQEIEAKRQAVVDQETSLLRTINKHVMKRIQPTLRKLRGNRLGQIAPRNEQYFTAKDILRCDDERDKSDYFTVLYTAELDVIQRRIEERMSLAQEALKQASGEKTAATQTA